MLPRILEKNNFNFLSKDYLPPLHFISRIKCIEEGNVEKEYILPQKVKVKIILGEEGEKTHCIDEPPIDEESMKKLLEYIYQGKKPESDSPLKYYYEKVSSTLPLIYPLLIDPNLEDIALNRPDEPVTVINRQAGGGWIRTNIILNEEDANIIARNLAKKAGKPLSPAYPFAEGVLPEGHRVAVSLGKSVSRLGTSFVIRVFNKRPPTLPQLIALNTLSPLMASYLWLLAEKQGFLMIIGGMATGKTTLLQAILNMFPETHRVVTIEDTPEMNLKLSNWDSLVTRESFSRSGEAPEIGLYELAKFALRRRAEHLVIGETRGVEARILAQAAATGHGSLTTFHADSVRSALYRLMSEPISLKTGFASLIWAFVQLRIVEEKRRVTSVIETIPRGPNKFSLRRVFSWDADEDSFHPDSPDELLERSYRLYRLAENIGLNRDDIVEELAGRAEFLASLSKKNVDAEELRHYVREFYRIKKSGTE